jgi:predicted alpha/beta hydrolase family esterase
MGRIVLVHGWDGSPKKDWFPWANRELAARGYEVVAPLMPRAGTPEIEPWVRKLKTVVGQPRNDDILIGHSIGCQAIFRYLEQLSSNRKVNKVILVAPWLKLANLESEAAWRIAEPWLTKPINFANVVPKAGAFIAFFSDDDPWVSLAINRPILIEVLKPQIVVLTGKGHFTRDEGVREIPEILRFL